MAALNLLVGLLVMNDMTLRSLGTLDEVKVD
jgi:hypothetical protein